MRPGLWRWRNENIYETENRTEAEDALLDQLREDLLATNGIWDLMDGITAAMKRGWKVKYIPDLLRGATLEDVRRLEEQNANPNRKT